MESKSRRSSLSSQLSIEQISKIEFKRVWQATEYSFQRPFIESCKFTNDNTGLYFAGSDGVLRHFDLVKEITIEYPICNGIIWAIDCSLDGEMICTCDAQRQVAVWDTKSMKCLATHHQHKDTVWRVNFTKNCNYVASCSSDLRIILWDFKNDASKLLTGHTKTIEDISFSRNGELLASSSQDRSIMLWKDMNHLPDMKCCAVLKGHENRVTCCVFASHRDDVIASASADCTVIIWDTVKQQQLLRIKGHFNVIWSCGFLRINCDTFVVSCSSDHSVRFWDSYTGAEVRKIKDFRLCEDLPSQLLCCQISKDGQKIAVTTADGAVYLASVNAVYGLENQDVCSILAALRLE